MKAMLLAGGLGTRLREETEFRPKPMVEVGGRPILWHIMKHLAVFGIQDFVIAVGYKGDMIRDYFLSYETRNRDFTVALGREGDLVLHGEHQESNWTVTVAFTGETTMTGGRVFRAGRYVEGERFLLTYGDGLADVDVGALVAAHEQRGRIATVTTVQPLSRFGVMDVDGDGRVISFREKPQLAGWVNAGFFIMEPGVFRYLNAECVLETGPLAALASDGELAAYRHTGFWQPMDTYREAQLLQGMWEAGEAPWKTW